MPAHNLVSLQKSDDTCFVAPERKGGLLGARPVKVNQSLENPKTTSTFIVMPTSTSRDVAEACAFLEGVKQIGGCGVQVNLYWGVVEDTCPKSYDWSLYSRLFNRAAEMGLAVKVCLCFHGSKDLSLPSWVLACGEQNPDIFPADKERRRSKECLSVGVDTVPVLQGRTALQAKQDFMKAFSWEFGKLLGGTITDLVIGMGPNGEVRYPSHPEEDGRWCYPGVGEFQCYDQYMLSSLAACAARQGQPHWGLSGPHDAGDYKQWPHQTGFFHHQGNWRSDYGHFFLQWYSSLLLQHASLMLSSARQVFAKDCGVRLHVKLPGVHWWYHHNAHAAELTAGIYNTSARNGYLPLLKLLEQHGVSAQLPCAELRTGQQSSEMMSDPQQLLLQMRGAASALHVPVSLENSGPLRELTALEEMERKMFEKAVYQGVDIHPAVHLSLNVDSPSCLQQDMRIRESLGRIHERLEQLRVQAARQNKCCSAAQQHLEQWQQLVLPLHLTPLHSWHDADHHTQVPQAQEVAKTQTPACV